MDIKSRKIPQSCWDNHKETILNLYLNNDLSIDKLVEAMDHDHGFTATVSQFEAQLRCWKARKNLRRHEWEEVLETVDSLGSRGVKSRVFVSDRLVSMKRIDRARRYCRGNNTSRRHHRTETGVNNELNDGNTSDIVIQTQAPGGQWSQYIHPVDEDPTLGRHQTRSNAALDVSTQMQLAENNGVRIGHTHDGSANHQYYENIDPPRLGILSPQLQSLYTPGLISDNWLAASGNEGAVQSMDFPLVGYESQEPRSFAQYRLYADSTCPNSELLTSPLRLTDLVQFPSATTYLYNLPFDIFERYLALKRLKLTTYPSPTQESGLVSGLLRLVNIFVTEAATIMTKANGKSFRANVDRAELNLQTLDYIRPRVQQGDGNNNIAGPSQMTTEAELHRLLLYSSANGFLGLEDIPIKCVFRFLNQNSNVTSLLTRLFRDNPSHVVRSLAENLFRAAIESGDHNTTRFLLQTGLVDVNETVYLVDGRMYTPLGRAAELQRLGVIKELLRFKPEVNKPIFNRRYVYGSLEGALGLLITGICPKDASKRDHSAFSSEYLEVVELLIKAGAKIYADCICCALRRFVRMDLAKKLLHALAPSDHSEALSTVSSNIPNLQYIAEELTDEEATEVITKILSDCEHTGCKQCSSRPFYSSAEHTTIVNSTIVVGAKQGYIQLVRSLFQYAKSPTQVLSAAIASRNHGLIEFVLAQKPDIRRAPCENIATRYGESQFTTPLAEAIGAEDALLIRKLESEGALETLGLINRKSESRFASAIAAASRVGDLEYVKKLLSIHPKATGHAMRRALLCAVKYRRECVVRLLLDVGAERDYNFEEQASLMIEAYKWGNQPVLTDLMSTFPDLDIYRINYDDPQESIMFREVFIENLESGDADMGMLEFFNQSGRLTRNILTRCLAIAVKRDDSAILSHLLECGADAINDLALENAVNGHTAMLRILLEHIPPTKMPIRSFGTGAVRKALEQDPSNIEALELLLACSAIDVRSCGSDETQPSPLGMAIQRDAASGCYGFPLTTRLLDAGCNVDQIVDIAGIGHRRRANKTAIIVAIETKNKSMVQFIISRGADINKVAIHGIKWTPLQAAAEQGSLDIVELLLQKGANANDKAAEHHGGTALQCAAMSGNCNIAATLLDHGASLYSPPSTFLGRSPIECAAEHGRLDMIQFLWNASLGFGFPIDQCRRAMELAEENGHIACKDLVLELAVSGGIMPMIEGSGSVI
ncbi:ankyrin [Whalleya microplaca]|nr:ankyrin [Whalleya microplaca]